MLEEKNRILFSVVKTKEKIAKELFLAVFLGNVTCTEGFSSLLIENREGLTSDSGSFDLGRQFCTFGD